MDRDLRSPIATLLLLLLSPWAMAQYKVIGPDGKVTYTDQAPAASAGKVQAIAIHGSAGGVPVNDLPAALRPAATRYPVTLYAGRDCKPCDSGRQLLVQRGIPFAEKRVESAADGEALARLSGDRSLPLLSIGTQQLKGLTSSEWHSYLDAAGYPKTSTLPASYRAPSPSALAPEPAAPARPASAPAPIEMPLPVQKNPSTPNIRF
jgi:glutaredoxin